MMRNRHRELYKAAVLLAGLFFVAFDIEKEDYRLVCPKIYPICLSTDERVQRTPLSAGISTAHVLLTILVSKLP